MALGSRLRRLSELITEDAAQIYKMYGVDLQPRWFPVFYVLSDKDDMTITEIANEIGHSHVSVSQIVKSMLKKGFVVEKNHKHDKRKTVVALSKAGREISAKIQDQYEDVQKAIEQALAETNHDIWKAIDEWEHLLQRKTLIRRVEEQRKVRETGKVEIVDFSMKYRHAFKALNEEWISTYFKMEAADYQALDHPKKYILDKGGHIFIALYNGEAVGTCAMMNMGKGVYELAKMAVSPKARGKNIGWLLGQAIIAKAKALGAKKLYLESNTKLKPAINLYYKLGFHKVTGHPSPYERCNIQMELGL